jgi:anti-sigma factor RsiW
LRFQRRAGQSFLQNNRPRRAERLYAVRVNYVNAMPVAQLTLEIRIEHAQLLKDRW